MDGGFSSHVTDYQRVYAHEIPQMIIQVENEQWSSAQVGLSETLVPHIFPIFSWWFHNFPS